MDKQLKNDLPTEIIAINFNIYEGSNQTYDIQMIGSDEYHEEDDGDWVCNALFSTGENLCFIPRTEDISDWDKGLALIKEFVKNYLINGKYLSKLKNYKVVAIGFVDGDIEVLYHNKANNIK